MRIVEILGSPVGSQLYIFCLSFSQLQPEAEFVISIVDIQTTTHVIR
jgi:hypothetical protein